MPAAPLLDHLIRPRQQRWRDGQAEGLGGLEVDDELELRGLLDRQVRWLGSLEDPIDVGGYTSVDLSVVGAIAHKSPGLNEVSELVECRQAMARSQGEQEIPMSIEEGTWIHQNSIRPRPGRSGERGIYVLRAVHVEDWE